MASNSTNVVPFSSRSYRYGGGMGVRGRLRLGSASRGVRVLSSASSSSMPMWAAQQHQELLAARDQEALAKLAAGGTDEFITYANERIGALGPGSTQDTWKSLLAQAQERKDVTQTENLVKQYSSQLQSGEMAGSAYMSFLSGQLSKFKQGSAEHTNLVAHMADAKKWIDLQTRALEKRHDEEMAASVQSGETKLEDALAYYKNRRSSLHPGDEAYASLTKQIGDLQNAIVARDFNTQINTAYAKMTEASKTDPIQAKKDYMAVLVNLMNTARDPAAQKQLQAQVAALDTSIKKDELLKDSQAVNAKMVDYFSGSGPSATEMYQFLQQKALAATDPAEAAKYTALASQITAHEAAKVRAAGGAGGAGAGFSVAATNRALNPFEKSYKDALDTVNGKISRDITPTESDWANLKLARDNYLNVAGQAYAQGNADVKGNMDNLTRAVKDAAGPPTDQQTSGASANPGWDFGKVGDAMAAKLVADAKQSTDEVTRASQKNDDPNLFMAAVAKNNADIRGVQSSPFIQGNPKFIDQLNELHQVNDSKVAEKMRDAKNVLNGSASVAGLAIHNLGNKYNAYVDGGGTMAMNDWLNAIKTSADPVAFSRLTGDNVTPVQFAALQGDLNKHTSQLQAARGTMVAIISHRDANGNVVPGSMPGGANGMDESDMLQRLNAAITGTPYSQMPMGAGVQSPDARDRNLSAPVGPQLPTLGGRSPSLMTEQPPQDQPAPGDAMLTSGEPGAADQGAPAPGGGGTDVVGTGAPMVPPQQPTDAMAATPQAPVDPMTTSGGLNAQDMTAASLDSGFVDQDPHAAAWAYLNASIDMSLPTFTMPDLMIEPAFMPNDTGSYDFGNYGGPTLTSGDEGGGPAFTPPDTNYDFPISGGGADTSGSGGNEPTLSM